MDERALEYKVTDWSSNRFALEEGANAGAPSINEASVPGGLF